MSNAISDAAEARRKAHEQWRKDDVTRALLEERVGYVTRGQAADDEGDEKASAKWASRVDQVDAELKRIGSADAIPSTRKTRKQAEPTPPPAPPAP